MRSNYLRALTATLAATAITIVSPGSGIAQEEAKKQAKSNAEAAAIDARAKEILGRAVDFLADAKFYSTTAEVWQDLVQADGSKLQFTKYVDIKLRRPDRLRVDIRTTVPKRSFFYDGKSLTYHDAQKHFYGIAEAPDSIDAMIAKVNEKLGVEFPLEDIMLSKPFGNGAAAAKSGSYLGLDPVLGKACHHLAFQSEAIGWQVWIEDGPLPALRKAVITFEEEVGSPQFTALFEAWDMDTQLADFVFEHDPIEGAVEIDFEPVESSE